MSSPSCTAGYQVGGCSGESCKGGTVELDNNDPTLSECCLRDLKQQAYANRLKEKLEAVDPIRKALELRNPIGNFGNLREEGTQSDSELDVSDEDDPFLQKLKKERIQQLQKQYLDQSQQVQEREIYPTLTLNSQDDFANDLQCWVEESREVLWSRWNVLHFTIEGFSMSEEVDEILSEVARSTTIQQAAVQVARVVVKNSRYVLFAPSTPLPSILLLEVQHINKILQAKIAATWSYFGDTVDKVHERSMKKWLKVHGVFANDSAEQNDGLDNDSDDNESAPCEVCGRTYAHKHFRGIQSSMFVAK